jgi:deoxycytidylate deaminase
MNRPELDELHAEQAAIWAEWDAWLNRRVAAALVREREHILNVVGDALRELFTRELEPIEKKLIELQTLLARLQTLHANERAERAGGNVLDLPSLRSARKASH